MSLIQRSSNILCAFGSSKRRLKMSFDFFSLIYGQEVCMVKLPSILSRASVFGTFVLMVGELGPRSLPFISSASPCSLRSRFWSQRSFFLKNSIFFDLIHSPSPLKVIAINSPPSKNHSPPSMSNLSLNNIQFFSYYIDPPPKSNSLMDSHICTRAWFFFFEPSSQILCAFEPNVCRSLFWNLWVRRRNSICDWDSKNADFSRGQNDLFYPKSQRFH